MTAKSSRNLKDKETNKGFDDEGKLIVDEGGKYCCLTCLHRVTHLLQNYKGVLLKKRQISSTIC